MGRYLLLLGASCAVAWPQSVEWYRQLNHPNGVSSHGKSGEQMIVYANGFGPTSSPVASGIVTQSGSSNTLPAITVGNIPVKITFVGLVSPSTFQFNIVLPTGLARNQPITATYNRQPTQKVSSSTWTAAASS
jgi:uncharacterized protein (TIGR03437 family)